MVRQNIGVPWQLDLAVLECGFVTRHILPVPFDRKHHLLDPGPVSERRFLGEILAVAARIHRAANESWQAVDNIEQHLRLLLERDVAQLDQKGRTPYQVRRELQWPDYGKVAGAAKVLAEATHQPSLNPRH